MNSDPLLQYQKICGQEIIDQLYQLAKPLEKVKLVHVSSTAMGGGVAEILTKLVPMTRSLGIQTDWKIIEGPLEFFECTKAMHNAIQGVKTFPLSSHLKLYEEVNKKNANLLREELEQADIVFVHDPQPLALIRYFPNRKGKWVWRCHIDASRPFRAMWKYLNQYIELYDATIFSLAEFAHPMPKPIFIIAPSIDPLSDKNKELETNEVEKVYDRFGLDKKRPIILQVSRFDRFKDPLGVIEAYRLAKDFNPNIQLVLAGSGAADDPEGEMVLNDVKNAVNGDPDIHILLLSPDSHLTINALQRAGDIILQKSVREGFGLTVTEALWKGKPVIGGNTGGIKLQVINNQTGFVVNTPEGAAYRIRYLLQHPEVSREMGLKAKEFATEKFLITRHLREYLTLIYSLLTGESDRIEIASYISSNIKGE